MNAPRSGSIPLTALLDFLRPELSAAVGAEQLANLRARARSLPLDVTRLVGFEVPLTPSGAGVDLLVQLAPAAALRRLLADDPELARSLGGGAELAAVLAALADARHPLAGRLGDAWLEYDTGSGPADTPSLFAAPSRLAAAPAVAALLSGGELEVEVAHTLARLLGSLGAEHLVQQIGVMHGRVGAPLRFVLRSSGGSSGPGAEVIAAAGWRVSRKRLDQALAYYGAHAPLHSLAVGFRPDGALSPTVGIELHLPRREDADDLLSVLCDDGLAEETTCRRLLAWHGHVVDDHGAGSPTAFRAALELTRGRVVPAIVRRIHHVKLTLAPDQPLSAKAYLGAHLRLVP